MYPLSHGGIKFSYMSSHMPAHLPNPFFCVASDPSAFPNVFFYLKRELECSFHCSNVWLPRRCLSVPLRRSMFLQGSYVLTAQQVRQVTPSTSVPHGSL